MCLQNFQVTFLIEFHRNALLDSYSPAVQLLLVGACPGNLLPTGRPALV